MYTLSSFASLGVNYLDCYFQKKSVTGGPDLSPENNLTTALQALKSDAISGRQILLIVRTFGTVSPISLLDKLFAEVDPDELSENDWKSLLPLSESSSKHLPNRYKTADMCAIACSNTASNIKFFPPPIRSNFLHQLVADNSCVYKFITEAEKTVELTRLALSCDQKNIENVPKKLLEQHPYLLDYVTKEVEPHYLRNIPKSLLTAEFVLKFAHPIYSAKKLFELLPEALKKDEAFLLAFCAGNGTSLKFMPPSLVNERVCKIAIDSTPLALEYVPKTVSNYQDLCWQAIRADGRAIAFIDPAEEFANFDFYIEACRHFNSDISAKSLEHVLSDVPPKFRTERLCRQAITLPKVRQGDYLEYLPESMRNDPAVCLEAVMVNGYNLEYVPESLKTEQLCSLAVRERWDSYAYTPRKLLTAPFITQIIESCTNTLGSPLESLIKEELTLDHCRMAIRRGNPRNISLAIVIYRKLTSKHPCEPLISRELLGGLYLKDLLCLLNNPDLDKNSRQTVIEYLTANCHPHPFDPPTADADKLYETVNPLVGLDFNPFLPELVFAGYQSTNFSPPLQPEGQALLDFVEQRGSDPLYPMPTSEPLQHSDNAELVGGRTLKLTENGETLYYKFQRKGELLTDLMGEGLTHHYMQQVKPALGKLLKSNMPRDPAFFMFPAEQLADLPAFRDQLEITQEDMGQKWVAVYRYRATPDYGIFAHQPNFSSENRVEKPEQGLLKACHDMGVFTGLGLVPTSTLPAFHDTSSKRSWIALHSTLGYSPNCVLSGTFRAWNTAATEYPDFGYSGFRDVFDVEPFGKISSYIKKSDAKIDCHPPDVQQRLMLANACIENLLAVFLVRSRLHQQFSCYHYKNPQALAQGVWFVESALTEFIQGYFCGTPPSVSAHKHNLQALMGLDDTDYRNWLERTVVEIIYWTAAQPDRSSPDQPAFAEGIFDHTDCYAMHLRQNKRLCSELYTDNTTSNKQYPEDFHNINNHLNLGAGNCLFPMTSLIKGLTRITANLINAS